MAVLHRFYCTHSHSLQPDDWKEVSTLNNLNDVYQLHCGGEPLKKATREVFVEGNMEDVREQFQVVKVRIF